MPGGPERWMGDEGPEAADLERWWRAAEGVASPEGMVFELRGGARVRVRPLAARDDAEAAGIERLSPEARHVRLLSEIARLDDAGEHGAHADADAWVAVRDDDPARVLGIARYVTSDDAPRVAELSVAVAEEQRGRGLGSLLVAHLGRSAARCGIERFRVHVLPANRASLHLMEDAGARVEGAGDEVPCFEMRVRPEPDGGPHVLRVLRTLESLIAEGERGTGGQPVRIPTCA